MKWLLYCLITLALGIVPAQAAEIIHDFDVTALIEQDGTVTITEKSTSPQNINQNQSRYLSGYSNYLYRQIQAITSTSFENHKN